MAETEDIVTVTVNKEALLARLKKQDVGVFVGIVITFIVLVIGAILIVVVEDARSAMAIVTAGFAVAFISLVLFYVQDVKAKNNIEDEIVKAETQEYDGVDRLDCPVFFTKALSGDGGTYTCKNTYGVLGAEGGGALPDIGSDAVARKDFSGHPYPWEAQYRTDTGSYMT